MLKLKLLCLCAIVCVVSAGAPDDDEDDDDGPMSMSCSNLCNTTFHAYLPCQCNAKCVKYKDCCQDYSIKCLSCNGRCGQDFQPNSQCQCNERCWDFDDCCDDVREQCDQHDQYQKPKVAVTDSELGILSEELLANDVNNCASLVTLNLQGSSCFSCTRDAAPEPLLTVRAEAYRKPTILKLLPLHNNYISGTGSAEVVTAEESTEEMDFLDSILSTVVMKKAEKFLLDKGLISNRRISPNGNVQTNNRAFRDALKQIWFGLYSRERRIDGSSGFEHVFLGEVKDGKVSGFHNWVFFSREEENNKLNYKGKIGTPVNLGSKGRIIKHKFDWNNKEKQISSMFVGPSPEFEMAIYTVCFYARPGAPCPVKLSNKSVNIQTHYFTKQGKRYVASAYPDI